MKRRCFFIITLFLLVTKVSIAQDTTSARAIDSTTIKTIDSASAVVSQPVDTKHLWHFSASPNIGFTFQGVSKDGEESEDMQWLSSLQAKLGFEGSLFQFNSNLFLQFGEQVTRESPPKKIQDNFQLSLVPSLTISDKFGMRLFFEVTGETEMGKGVIDSVETTFLDPLFLYETLFLGHKTHISFDDGNSDFEFILGAGYAYQQMYAKKFILEQNRKFVVDENNPLSSIQDQFTVEKGYSAILQLNLTKKIGDNFTFKESLKTVLLTKDGFTRNIENSRVAGLLLTGIQYKIFSIDYTLHVVYDRNISMRRQLDQTMVFGLRFDI